MIALRCNVLSTCVPSHKLEKRSLASRPTAGRNPEAGTFDSSARHAFTSPSPSPSSCIENSDFARMLPAVTIRSFYHGELHTPVWIWLPDLISCSSSSSSSLSSSSFPKSTTPLPLLTGYRRGGTPHQPYCPPACGGPSRDIFGIPRPDDEHQPALISTSRVSARELS